MNVLVVEDDKTCRLEMADFLRQLGHCVDECIDGLEALDKINNHEYQMVLSDIKMPRMSGIDMLKSIVKSPNRFSTDVVLVTGHGDVEFAIEAIRAGAFDYLLKPIEVKELVQITERINERHHNSTIRILLNVNSTIFREGLKYILHQVNEFSILGQTYSMKETIQAIEKTKPDIVLVESKNINDGNEFKLIKDQFKFKTLALCPLRNEPLKMPLMNSFNGVLSQDACKEEIILAIKTVYKGTFYLSPHFSEELIKQSHLSEEISKLNEQELKIFYYLAGGKTNTEIAQELYLSSSTVKTYVSKILQKLNLPNRAAAAVYAAKAYENGYLKSFNTAM